MIYIMNMSTNQDIINTQVNASWLPITERFSWAQVAQMNLNVPENSTIIVVAHGNNGEIGNAKPGIIDIDAHTFLALVQSNMVAVSTPTSIYISTCGQSIAAFAAAVRIAAQNNKIWANTRIFGHNQAISGNVPPQNSIDWVEIY